MKGTVFDIQHFCIGDGPGIRTTVFLKGCPLQCVWCHNPESQKSRAELLFYEDKCVHCGFCERVCPNACHSVSDTIHSFDRAKCVACGKCTAADCGALTVTGAVKSVHDVMYEVLKDKAFYNNSGGGITLSGGEPLMQADFSREILKAAKENGINTCIETCGFAKKETILDIAQYTDIFLYDYKETNSARHKEYTGVGNEKIIENLKILDQNGKKIILRCPIIPGFNDRDEHFKGIAETANSTPNIVEVDVEPYHPLGESKRIALGEASVLHIPITDEQISDVWVENIKKYTEKTVKKV